MLLVVLAAAAFVAWALTPLGPAPEALASLVSDESISVTQSPSGIVFTPAEEEPCAGFILYPGGRVDVRSYAPLARRIAERGYLVALVPMRLNLAVLSPDRADEIINAHPDVQVWGIGGHSLGGTMAARYADHNPQRIAALALLASYPSQDTHLEDDDVAVVSILGTADGIVSGEKASSALPRLPTDAQRVAIDGGNHAQFGSYGEQPGDDPATISVQEQQEQTAQAIALLMRPFRLKTR